LTEANGQITAPPDKIVVVSGEDWPAGLLGLVANRLLDRYGVAAVVVSRSGDICRGSGRGPGGVELVDALGRARARLRALGGATRAAGFTVVAGDLDAVIATLRASIQPATTDTRATGASRAEIVADCSLPLNRVTWSYYEKIGALAPFGQGFPEPVFVAKR